MRPLALAAALLLAAPAQAAILAGDEIAALVVGRTVEGGMTDSGPYAEFYEPGGAIRGDGYAGAWTIEGDEMCLAYGAEPATCFGVGFQGDVVEWVRGGEVVGDGRVVEGNPYGF